jgi:hypothetical protein
MLAFGVAQFGSMQKVSILVFESNFHMILAEKTTHDHGVFILVVTRTILYEFPLRCYL